MENNDLNRQILEEVRKLRRESRWGMGVALLFLLLAGGWAFFQIHRIHATPWSKVTEAMSHYDYQKALKLTQDMAAEHPNDYYVHGYLAYIYLEMDDLVHAEAEYVRSYELFPSESSQKKLEAIRKRRQEETQKPSSTNR